MSRRSCRPPASAASRQTERTSTLRPAIRAVPHAWVASNALAYVRPCLARMPKALPPRISTAGRENIATTTATTRVAGSGEEPGEHDIEPGGDHEQQRNHDREGQLRSPAPAVHWTSGRTTPAPASQTRWDTGTGTGRRASPRIRPDSAVRGMAARASPRRCRATPATVRPNDTRPIEAISAVSASEKSSCSGDPPARIVEQSDDRLPR